MPIIKGDDYPISDQDFGDDPNVTEVTRLPQKKQRSKASRVTPNRQKNAPVGQSDQKTTVIASKTWQGPLPSPEDMSGYSRAIPNGGDRIMTAWEKESAHRREMEIQQIELLKLDRSLVKIDILSSKIITFLFLLGSLGLVFYCAYHGLQWGVIVLGGGVIASVTWALRHSWNSDKKQ